VYKSELHICFIKQYDKKKTLEKQIKNIRNTIRHLEVSENPDHERKSKCLKYALNRLINRHRPVLEGLN